MNTSGEAEIRVDANTYEVVVRGQRVDIGGDAFRLLLFLAAHPNEAISKAELKRHLWEADASRSRKDVERLVHALRRKVELHPSGPVHIVTVPEGYIARRVAVDRSESTRNPLSPKLAAPAQATIGGSQLAPFAAAAGLGTAGLATATTADPTHEIWYRGIQRIYRNAFVEHVRRCFQEAFGGGATERLQKIFGKTWDEMKADALAARETHEIESPIEDDYDLLGVNNFYNVLAAHFAALAPALTGKPAETVQRVRTQALEYASTVTSVRNPLSHPAAAPLSYEDAFRTIDAARRLLEICGRVEALELQGLLDHLRWTDISGPPLARREVALEDRLPPRERIGFDFVGRKRELQELLEWLQDGRAKHWALVGEGGKGKSALAYELALAAKTRAPEPLSLILWITAKRRRFDLGQVFEEAPDFWSLESELDALLKQYGWVEHLKDPLESKKERVLSLLTEFPALLVVDDIDSLSAVDEGAIQFLTVDVSRTPSRVLMTLRRRIFGLGHLVTQVEGLQGAEAQAFIDSRIRSFNLDADVFSPRRRGRVIEVTEGSPLYMEDLLRLCAAMPLETAIERWADKRGDAARVYALQREFELLDGAARAVLLAAALFDGPVALPELQAITAMDEDTLDAAIRALQDLYLFPKPRLIQSIDRFDVNVNVRTLVRRTLGNTDMYLKVQNAAKAVKGELDRTREEEARLGSFQRQAVALAGRGLMIEAESTLLAGLKEFPEAPELLGQLGLVYKDWSPKPRLSDARDSFRRAVQLKTREADTYRQWTDLEVNEREWGEAARIAELAISLLEGHPDHYTFIQFAGFATSRWAQQPRMTKKWALEKFEASNKFYWRALKGPVNLDTVSRCYWGLAINARLMRNLPTPAEGMSRSKAILQGVFTQWRRRVPVDVRRDQEVRFAADVWPDLVAAAADTDESEAPARPL